MDEQRWMIFINHYWLTIAYRDILKHFREGKLQGMFFGLCAVACQHELLMMIAHAVHLCEEVSKEYDVGPDAMKVLAELKALYAQGDSKNQAKLNFDDCGIKPFRDKLLAHPLNQIKMVLGKPEYHIDLKWDTIEATLNKIKEFAHHVEEHHGRLGQWNFWTDKGSVGSVEVALTQVTLEVEDAAKYEKLKREIGLGKKLVKWDWNKDEILVEELPRAGGRSEDKGDVR
jgi:hypothetical protein